MKLEWFKRLTRPARDPEKSLQLCSCLIWGSQKSSQLCLCLISGGPGPPPEPPEPPALQSRSAGAGGWTPACTSRPSMGEHGRRLDLPVLDLRKAHGNLP